MNYIIKTTLLFFSLLSLGAASPKVSKLGQDDVIKVTRAFAGDTIDVKEFVITSKSISVANQKKNVGSIILKEKEKLQLDEFFKQLYRAKETSSNPCYFTVKVFKKNRMVSKKIIKVLEFRESKEEILSLYSFFDRLNK